MTDAIARVDVARLDNDGLEKDGWTTKDTTLTDGK